MTNAALESSAFIGTLTLGHVLATTGVVISDVVVLRHTYTVGGLETAADLTPEKVLEYTRRQSINNKLGKPHHGYGSSSSLTAGVALASWSPTRTTVS